ncbi:phosphonopyruvate decarboxylase [Chitinasiproducens palmae]|uniref:Phosphonopyruvate decarboxylase n=1 Tax=Chitinasiproducens palmae TaxID=1770053 RepID=A0A1H2PSF1_9BURK|nr:phosphonopyruvate decarboxylase [Chitinasiproducens palmae]SDV49865.1 phosphonopyruvate decarboxylase [Chitinasiproducens palmae]
MIEAKDFIEAARARGIDRYAGVPCSYLTPFINYVLQDPTLHYLSAANEGDAVAVNAGVALAGGVGITMMQNSGLGNAVSPLTSLTWTFGLPQLLIVTWRGQPGVADEPQHALMGPITPQLLDLMEIPWELFPTERGQIEPALERAFAYMSSTGRPYALLMQKGSVAPVALARALTPSSSNRHDMSVRHEPVAQTLPARREALERVIALTPVEKNVVFASTGFCGRELYALDDRPNQLYMVGSMGCVTPLALGFALMRPDLRVVAVDGDGAALMRMGVFATLGSYGPRNLLHILLDNGVHDSTGGQHSVSPNVSFAGVAAACGYGEAREGSALSVVDALFAQTASAGCRFAGLNIRPGTPDGLPRPTVTPVQVRDRLQRHIGIGARHFSTTTGAKP